MPRKVHLEVELTSYYFFSDAYFNAIKDLPEKSLKLFCVRQNDKVVAAALFMAYNGFIHYHLAGSDFVLRKYAANNLLLQEAAEWGIDNGFNVLHLGGGLTANTNDTLMRFKTSISRKLLPFYIGKRVHDKITYRRLCAAWMQRECQKVLPNYFLFYRL